MTKAEYAAYVERVETYLKGLEAVSTGATRGCEECCSDFGVRFGEHDPEECGCDYLGNGSWDCGHVDGEDEEPLNDEGGFSWSPCEVCDSSLGGNRYTWHAIIPKDGDVKGGTMVHGTCCEDCVYFINYGKLDDSTMWDIEHDQPKDE